MTLSSTMKAHRPDLSVGTVNVGTVKGTGAEVADMLKRRRVDVCECQEVRFKGGRTIIFTYDFYYINIIYCMS